MGKNVLLIVWMFFALLFTLTCKKSDEDKKPEKEDDYKIVDLVTDNVLNMDVVDTVTYNGQKYPVYDIALEVPDEEVEEIEPGKVVYVNKEGEGGKVILVIEVEGGTKSASYSSGFIALAIRGIQTTLDMYFCEENSEVLFATTDNRSRKYTTIANKVTGATPYSLISSDFKFKIEPKDSLSVEVTSKPDKLFQSKISGTFWKSDDGESSISLDGSLSLHPAFDLNLKYEPKKVEEGSDTYSSVLGWLEAAAVPDYIMALYQGKDYLLGNMKQVRTNVYTDVDLNFTFAVKLAKKIKYKKSIPFARLIVASPSVTTFTDAAFEFDLEAMASGEYELSVDIKNDLVMGVNLHRDLADAIWYYEYNNSAKGGAKLKGKVEITKGISLVFDTEVYVMGLLGPHFKIGPVIEAKATANAVYDMNDGVAYDWKFSVDYGINGEASLDLSLFHLDAATTQLYEMKDIEVRRNLYAAPDSVKVVSGDKQEGIQGERLPKPIKVGVYDSNNGLITSLPVPVYFKTDFGSLKPEGPICTDSEGFVTTSWTLGEDEGDQTLNVFLKEAGSKKNEIEITATAKKDSALVDSRDGTKYDIVKIGTQTWMAENLAYKAGEGCWAYEGSEYNALIRGRLYTWELARTACPSGWHLPTHEEFEQLAQYVSNQEGPYNRLGEGWNGWEKVGGHLKSTSSSWLSEEGIIGHGTDDFGFRAHPTGVVYYYNIYDYTGWHTETGWWSASTKTSTKWPYNEEPVSWNLDYRFSHFFWEIGSDFHTVGRSVRCVKD